MRVWITMSAHFAALVFLFMQFQLPAALSSPSLPKHEIIRFDRHVAKRSTSESSSQYERISFEALGHHFNAIVWPTKAPVHHNFRVLLGSEGEQELPTDLDGLYSGYIVGNKSNRVLLSKIGSGGYFGTIEMNDDVFHLEPAQLHLEDAHERDIMIYRASDVDRERGRFLRDQVFLRKENDVSINPNSRNPFLTARRRKRQVEPLENFKKNRCPMKIVADYKFFSIVGKNNTALTTRYIVNMIANVNEIFRKVNWDEGREDTIVDRGRFFNMGFSIKELKILDKPSRMRGHYNGFGYEKYGQWNISELLATFTREESSPNFCLVHLLTAQSFPESASIGLAYVARIQENRPVGGICSTSRSSHHPSYSSMCYNTLLTSAVGHTGNTDYPLVTREAEIVVAHEYGHSWGAQHDTNELNDSAQEQTDCVPDYSHGGNYIMHAFAQNGYDPNNNKFSPCSVLSIRNVLEKCSPLCFEEEKSSFCGNGVMEEGEECDEGALLSSNETSSCCRRNCTLLPSAMCSPHNQPCCTATCSFHDESHVCMPGNAWQCTAESHCTGSSGECPPPAAVSNGSPCVEEGECRNGQCLPYCERSDVGKKSCICEEVHLSCHRCCRSLNGSGVCEPQLGAADLPDGTWCVQGYCKNSKCVTAVADYMTFYISVLQDGSRVWPFVKSNLVGITVILSIFIWVPCGILIKKLDRRSRVEIDAADMFVTPQIPVPAPPPVERERPDLSNVSRFDTNTLL